MLDELDLGNWGSWGRMSGMWKRSGEVGDVWQRRDEAGGVTGGWRGSGLGHGTGLLFIDVAAHAAGVHAWRDHRGQQRGGQGKIEGGRVIVRGGGSRRHSRARRGCAKV